MPTPEEGSDALAAVRATRGYHLPVHELFAQVSPELLAAYDGLATRLLFGQGGEGAGRLDDKTRALVLLGITTAVRGDRDGIELGFDRARRAGATEIEMLEAIALAALPAGVPAVEFAATVWKEQTGAVAEGE